MRNLASCLASLYCNIPAGTESIGATELCVGTESMYYKTRVRSDSEVLGRCGRLSLCTPSVTTVQCVGGCGRAGTVSGRKPWHMWVGLQLGRLLSPAELMGLLACEPAYQDPPSEVRRDPNESNSVGGEAGGWAGRADGWVGWQAGDWAGRRAGGGTIEGTLWEGAQPPQA